MLVGAEADHPEGGPSEVGRLWLAGCGWLARGLVDESLSGAALSRVQILVAELGKGVI